MNNRLKIYLLGNFSTFLGNSLFMFLLSWWVVKESGSANILGQVMAVINIPVIFLNLFAGSIVDRYNRKYILIISDLLAGIFCFISYFILKDQYNIFVLTVLFLLLNILKQFFSIASNAIITDIVAKENLMRFNSLKVSIKESANILGPLIANLLIIYLNPSLIILINGISFVFSGLSEFFIINPKKEKAIKNPDILGGFKYLIRNKEIFYIVLFASIYNFVLMGYNLYLPIFTIKIIGKDSLLSILMVASSLGVILSPWLINTFKKLDDLITFNNVVLLSGVPLLMILFNSNSLYLALNVFLFHVFLTIFNIKFFVKLQKEVSTSVMGRVFASITSIVLCLTPLSYFLWGKLGGHIDSISLPFVGFCIIVLQLGLNIIKK